MTETQLQLLARKIPPHFIGDNGRGFDAMDHTVVTQLLLRYLGPYSFEVTEVIYDQPKKGGERIVTGVIGKLTVEIDGKKVTISEPGGVENAFNNIDGGGERAKHAASDAIKRCAMRLGMGLHLWAQDKDGNSLYFLDKKLKEDAEAREAENG